MKKKTYSQEAKKTDNTPLNKKRYRGLCSYCEYAPTCTYPRDPERPVLECDEVQGLVYSLPKKRSPQNTFVPDPHRNIEATDNLFQQSKGLCKTCEERATCTYPKPEGGVWHCEEFR